MDPDRCPVRLAFVLAGVMAASSRVSTILALQGIAFPQLAWLSSPTLRPAIRLKSTPKSPNYLALEAERALGSNSYLDCFRNTPNRNGVQQFTASTISLLELLGGITLKTRSSDSIDG
ncbi:hypothetical protein BS47DRAFT_1359285 [Hydnum rufescens UP504]|uniref:Uncharacterized protein n=1 Tax=Hydnum rufescens UP504 TaxID=1448309 RepID=A0A9P6B5D5_9AGAM|nr:hypothetical protein BS47DRAFT_1359285 [Hydnum rufescens UP504]